MENTLQARKVLKIFFNRKCKQKFEALKEKLKNHNNGYVELYHTGENYSLFELKRFDVDIIINDLEEGEIYTRYDGFFVRCNPFQ